MDDDDDFKIPVLTLIPEGIYDVTYVRYVVFMFNGKAPKLAITFSILELGRYAGVEIERYYNLAGIKKGKGKHKDRPIFKKRGAFMDEMIPIIYKDGYNPRYDRIGLEKSLKGKVISVRVGTVKKNHKQKMVPACLQYSVIEEVLG